MTFLKRHKIFLLLVVFILLTGLFLNYFITHQKFDNRDIGTFDLGPHPSEVMIRFEREYKGLKYQDALNFTRKEYDALTKEDILTMQDERFNNWVKIIDGSN